MQSVLKGTEFTASCHFYVQSTACRVISLADKKPPQIQTIWHMCLS